MGKKLPKNRRINDFHIVLIGELLVDSIKKDDRYLPYTFGGSPANISVNLKQLGIHPVLFSAVGNDDEGHFLIAKLLENELITENISITNQRTTKVVIEDVTGNPKPSFYRNADAQIEYTEELANAIKNAKILHFSYWPLSKEPAKSTVLKAIQQAKQEGVLIGFDPNFHEGLVGEDSMTIDDIKELIRQVDIIKPSLDDAERLFGPHESPLQYLHNFEKLGPSIIVLTLGKDGAMVSYQGTITKFDSLAKEVVDVTGAGDAFWSGLYAGMLTNESIIDAVKIGLLCSAYALREYGAITIIPSISDLKKKLG